jgi:hypothetical protein
LTNVKIRLARSLGFVGKGPAGMCGSVQIFDDDECKLPSTKNIFVKKFVHL